MATGQRQNGEIRDAVHGFVRIEHDEWSLLDSRFVQRLRNIHQLAMTHLLYPGATHKRFEHSLGVMELAGRVYDVITDRRLADPDILNRYGLDERGLQYWRKVLRMAGLCHDIGHLPFSHAAEGTLLPSGKSHENITAELILSEDMAPLWQRIGDDGLDPLDVAKVAVGSKRLPESVQDRNLGDLRGLLHDVIAHDALGVDRIDYLLRDSTHAGVAYGRFDHLRLLDTIRILPRSSSTDSPALGLEQGGIHSAEALLLARYFMFMQVYNHPVRAAYDVHLQDFMGQWLDSPLSDTSWKMLQSLTDVEVSIAIQQASEDQSRPGHDAATRIDGRDHFRLGRRITRQDRQRAEDALEQYLVVLQNRLGPQNVRTWAHPQSTRVSGSFPVMTSDGSIRSAREVSDVLEALPTPAASFLLVPSHLIPNARDLINNHELEVR